MKTSPSRFGAILAISFCLPFSLGFGNHRSAAPTLELYGNFHAMGVNVSINSADDPNANASAQVAYWIHGSTSRLTGQPLSRVLPGRFSGSLFWLTPGTQYDVEVTITDPDGGSLNNATVRGSASTRVEITIPTALHSYYASPTGSGTQCSQSSPCALRGAIDLAQAGDEVVLGGGTYYEGGIDLLRSGTAGAPIVIRSYTGETATLDGSDPGTFTWTSEGSGIFSTTVHQANPHVVLASQKRLFPYRTLSDLQGLIYGTSGMLASGTTLRVHLAGDTSPATVPMVISRYNFAFHVEQNNIYFVGLTFRYYGLGDSAKAIYFLDGSDNLVRACTFTSNDVGVGIKYESHRNVIENSEFFDSVYGWSWDGVKQNSAWSIEDGGIYVYEPCTGRGTVIRRNTFHDDFDGLHVSPEEGTTTSETDVYENQVHHVVDDGIEVDGYAANVRLWRNTFHDCLMGVSLAPCYVGPVYAIRNLIYRFGATALSEPDGSAFKFNSGYDASGPMFLYHNTGDAVTANINSLTLWEPGSWSIIISRNNIWAGTAYVLANYNTTQPLDMDYDDLYTSRSGELVWWERLGDDGHLRTLAEFRSATGLETHGLSELPGFENPTAGTYRLLAASPLIDRGVYLPGINDGYAGAAPDLGAFETGSSITKDDLIGSWKGQGVYSRDSNTGNWIYWTSPASQLALGDIDGDGIDDIIGVWDSGTWCRQSSNGAWVWIGSPAVNLSVGDLNGDSRKGILGVWGSDIYYRNSLTGSWELISSGASRVTAGDLDGDGKDDLIGVWPSGVWVKYSSNSNWVRLASAADAIAIGDMNGDGRADLVGSWAGQGIFVRDTASGAWTLITSASTRIACGDLDGDGKDDLVGVWPSGTWVRYSANGNWVLLASAADCISVGKLEEN